MYLKFLRIFALTVISLSVITVGAFAQSNKHNSIPDVNTTGKLLVINDTELTLNAGDPVSLDTTLIFILNAKTSAALNLAMMIPDSFIVNFNDSIPNAFRQIILEFDTTGLAGAMTDTAIFHLTIFNTDSAGSGGNTHTSFIDTVVDFTAYPITIGYHVSVIDSIDGFRVDNVVSMTVRSALLRSVVPDSTNIYDVIGSVDDNILPDGSGLITLNGNIGWATVDAYVAGSDTTSVRRGDHLTNLTNTASADWIKDSFIDSTILTGKLKLMSDPQALEFVGGSEVNKKIRVIIK
ncbi:MAG: hypothetical protein ACUZ8I_10420 [Candidatus Scalindua sp.]